MKGNKVYEELSCSNNAINLLGCQVIEVKSFNLPKNNYRAVVAIQKIKNTKTEEIKQELINYIETAF